MLGWSSTPEGPRAMVAEPGTAVGDLQALDKNGELYSDFEVLDDLQAQKDVDARIRESTRREDSVM